ncbi:Sucrose transporter and related proteins [Phaffia rhodozyma]|uniref:Sucrose transporter and related proteins n=1 Tax=Phaffia rhodozyma TaxID=264483 RepID=A0A0F7SLC2_PHARH|nr:Sucrose transporter and related proteins [Phaffia rhodozyma]
MSDPSVDPSSKKKLSIIAPGEIPSAGPSPSEGNLVSSPHTYTSLSSLRKAQKGKEPDKGDRKNGWHLWSQEGGHNQAASSRRGSYGQGQDVERGPGGNRSSESKKVPHKLTLLNMITMTLGMGGAQIAWCLEMGFGNQELLALGLTEELTSLVWLAGPISGLITQPLIGAISDASYSKYRRRYWVVLATIVMIIATLALAYARPLGALAADIVGAGEGDWDPKWIKVSKNWSIGIAIAAFYLLDFAVNAVQASLRNLVLDVTPAEQLSSANAWIGRMTHMGNILGFTLGFLDLSTFPLLAWLGGGNFRKFCVIIILILGLTVWVTCATTHETAREKEFGVRPGGVRDIAYNIYDSIIHLPRPIRRVCYVQVFAFMSWFPFLFYGTTWVAEVMANSQRHKTRDEQARAGSLAMLFYSIVAVIAGTVLPYLADRDRRLLAPDLLEDGDEDETPEEKEFRKIKEMVKGWKEEAKRDKKPVKLPILPFMLRNIWTAALILFAVMMLATFLVTEVWGATVIIALIGACWAVAAWVPFSLLMEYLKEMEEVKDKPVVTARTQEEPVVPRYLRTHGRSATTAGLVQAPQRASSTFLIPNRPNERSSLLKRSKSMIDTTEHDDEDGENRMESEAKGPVATGSILGVHNLSVVFPQFVVALVSSLIFRVVAAAQHPAPSPPGGSDQNMPEDGENPNGVVWVLRFGGLCALVAAAISRKVPPTKTEKAMRRRLIEMKAVEEEGDNE